MTISIQGLDHFHIRVSDRDKAAAWYKRVLGLTIDPRYYAWAADADGPLFLATPMGARALALIQADTSHNRIGDHTVAFAVAGADFVAFLNSLDEFRLTDRDGSTLIRSDVADHELSWSIYFLDPDGNRIELTSYDYGEVASVLEGRPRS